MRELHRPVCVADLFALMDCFPDARIMAGGTDLLVHLRSAVKGEKAPLLLLENIDEIRTVSTDGSRIRIGAAISLSHLIDDPLIMAHAPLLARACRSIGGPALRNMATIGGNIVTASPAGDSLPALFLLNAQLELASRLAVRHLAIGDFIKGPGKTSLQSGEILTCIRIARQNPGDVMRFEKIGLRKAMAISVASFAGLLRFSADSTVHEASFAWGSVAPTVVRFTDLESALRDKRIDPSLVREMVSQMKNRVSPISDIRATAEYRRSVAANMLQRFLDGTHD